MSVAEQTRARRIQDSASGCLIYGVELSRDVADQLLRLPDAYTAFPLLAVLPKLNEMQDDDLPAAVGHLRIFRSNQFRNRAFVGLPLRYITDTREAAFPREFPVDLPTLHDPTDPEVVARTKAAIAFLMKLGLAVLDPEQHPRLYVPFVNEE